MKKTNTLIVLLTIASLSFGLNNKSAMTVNNDFDLSFNSNQDVYGIQFDMRYDASVISVDELTNASSLVDGIDIYARTKEPGFVRVLMFSMNLDKIASANQFTNVIDFNITPLTTDASLNPVIVFDNIIVAGENGQELDYPSTFEYEVSNSDLVPTSTALSNVYPNPFATKYDSTADGTFPVIVGQTGLGQTTYFEHEVGTDQINPNGTTTTVTSFIESFDKLIISTLNLSEKYPQSDFSISS